MQFFFLLSIIIFNFTFPTWTLVIISLTNDLSVMATSFDKVNSSDLPKTWNMTKELLVASALATVSTGMLILLLVCKLTQVVWSVFLFKFLIKAIDYIFERF